MRCKDFQELISAYIDNELDDEQGKLLENHLSQCDGCNDIYKQTLKINDRAKYLAVYPPEWLGRSVMATINKEKLKPVKNKFRVPFWAKTAGIAAACLLLIMSTTYFQNTPKQKTSINSIGSKAIESRPAGLHLQSKVQLSNGIRLVFSEAEDNGTKEDTRTMDKGLGSVKGTVETSKTLELEILNLSIDGTLKDSGQGSTISSKALLTYGNNDQMNKLDIEKTNMEVPWINVLIKQNNKLVRISSKDLNGEELTKAIRELSNNVEILNNKINLEQVSEVNSILRSISPGEVEKIKETVQGLSSKGWKITDRSQSGESGKFSGIEIDLMKRFVILYY